MNYKSAIWFRGSTPLHIAALEGKLEIVEYLLDTPEVKSEININAVNRNSLFPLHYAAMNGHKTVCEKLLIHGASLKAGIRDDPEFEPKLNTPLHYAANNNQLEIVKLFVYMGASITAKNSEGLTPLDHANEEGCSEIITFLNEHFSIQEQAHKIEESKEMKLNVAGEVSLTNDLANDF